MINNVFVYLVQIVLWLLNSLQKAKDLIVTIPLFNYKTAPNSIILTKKHLISPIKPGIVERAQVILQSIQIVPERDPN